MPKTQRATTGFSEILTRACYEIRTKPEMRWPVTGAPAPCTRSSQARFFALGAGVRLFQNRNSLPTPKIFYSASPKKSHILL